MNLTSFVPATQYPVLVNGRENGVSHALYGNNPRSWNIFSQRASPYLRETGWGSVGIQGATCPTGTVPTDFQDGVGRINVTGGEIANGKSLSLNPATWYDVGLPGGNVGFYYDGVSGWLDYNVSEDYWAITYTRGQTWTASCSRLQINTGIQPSLVPIKETLVFRIPENYPADSIHHTHNPFNTGGHTYRNRDTLIWQKKHGTASDGPFMAMYVTTSLNDKPYLSLGMNTNSIRTDVVGFEFELGTWHTLEIYFMLGSFEYNRVYGTLDGIPFEYTFTGRCVFGTDADIALAGNAPGGMCGIYSYYNTSSPTYYSPDDNLAMDVANNSPTKSLHVRKWKYEVMSNPGSLKPILPRTSRIT